MTATAHRAQNSFGYWMNIFTDPCAPSGLACCEIYNSETDAIQSLVTEDGDIAAGYLHTLHVTDAAPAFRGLSSEILYLNLLARRQAQQIPAERGFGDGR
jgi:hypothetical protein